jgi:thiamine-phosphate pyrophosphorylase
VRLHAIVDDLETARVAAEGGATILQLRVKCATTQDIVRRGVAFRSLARRAGVQLVVNDDVVAALELGADGVHLGRGDEGVERAVAAGLTLGRSAATVDEAVEAAKRGATYVGAGPVWATPSKPDADPPTGLDGLRAICDASSIPVVAIGGIDAPNAVDCIRAGAAGVAVIRAATDAATLRRAIDEALAAR